MTERWYQKAVIYCLDVETFQDSDGDGVGDFPGLIGRLDYLARLGVDCLWLNPIHPSPGRDDGYDVTDFYNVDPRLGTLGDFAELLHAADNRGIRVIIDLVVNHTSDEHPWFRSARSSPDSPYRDWYVWSEPSRPTGARAWSSPASRTRPGRTTGPRAPGTTTGSTSSSRTSTSATPGPRRDQEDRVVLAAARGGRVPDGRGAVHHRKHRAGRQHGR